MPEITVHAVTCRTVGCPSENYTITLPNPGDLVVCGGCSIQITDIVPPLPEPAPVPDPEDDPSPSL